LAHLQKNPFVANSLVILVGNLQKNAKNCCKKFLPFLQAVVDLAAAAAVAEVAAAKEHLPGLLLAHVGPVLAGVEDEEIS